MHERFRFKSKEDLLLKAKQLGLDLPYNEDIKSLFATISFEEHLIANRLVVQPMEGYDSLTDGTPSDLTRRRYLRYAEGGSGIIWFEAVAVSSDSRSNPKQLWLHKDNIDNYEFLCRDVRKHAEAHKNNPLLVIQLTHSGRYSKPKGKPEPLVPEFNPLLDKGSPHLISDDELKEFRISLLYQPALLSLPVLMR